MTTIKLNLNYLINSANSHGIVEIDVTDELAKQHEIAIIWSIDDVKEVRPDLNKDQAWELLEKVRQEHDALLGVSWDTLKCHADDLFPKTIRGK